MRKKSLKWVPQPKDWGPEKGAFLGASKGRTNWQGTAFSPCEAELKCTPGPPPGGSPGHPPFGGKRPRVPPLCRLLGGMSSTARFPFLKSLKERYDEDIADNRININKFSH